MNVVTPVESLSAKDFATDQEVRWCPGCGDYAILRGMQKTLADIGVAPANTVFVSGIGCASRFPYYMATYGFHTIHGRAPAVATGIKLANPELDVWVVMGDGDGLSIGGNHLLHVLRRNVDMQILLFNNEIYGLTKGQYSPTSRTGTRSPSTPMGSVEHPISAAAFALGAGTHFVARSIDTLQKHLPKMFRRAHDHRGSSFVEIFQNCIVYNDHVFASFTDKDVAERAQIHLEHGKPLVFGPEDARRGLRLNAETLSLEAVTLGENGIGEDDILVHDETNRTLATMLAEMEPPTMPVALGVLYCVPNDTYEMSIVSQIEEAKARGDGDLNMLLRRGHTWEISG
jgi:2-oxoglutarate ferredoxin oxidoreductase subunit beta